LANYRNRVSVGITSGGTGALGLGSAIPGYRALADAYPAATTVAGISYVLTDGHAFEVGLGTLNSDGSF